MRPRHFHDRPKLHTGGAGRLTGSAVEALVDVGLKSRVIEAHQAEIRLFDLPHPSPRAVAFVPQDAEGRALGEAQTAMDAGPHLGHVDVGDGVGDPRLLHVVLEVQGGQRTVHQMPPTNRPGLRTPRGSRLALSPRIKANPAGGGPHTSSEAFSAAGARSTTKEPPGPSASRNRLTTGSAMPGSGRTWTTPTPGWAITLASVPMASTSRGTPVRLVAARRTTAGAGAAGQPRAASQNIGAGSSTWPPASLAAAATRSRAAATSAWYPSSRAANTHGRGAVTPHCPSASRFSTALAAGRR